MLHGADDPHPGPMIFASAWSPMFANSSYVVTIPGSNQRPDLSLKIPC